MTTKHMYQHPLVQDLKGYFITKQLAYTNVRSGPANNLLTPICVYSEIIVPSVCAHLCLLAIVPFPVERITEVTHPKLRLPLHPAHKG